MKRTFTLLAVGVITINSVGCCCCRGLRDWFSQGAFCGVRNPAPAPTYSVAPPPAPVYPQYCPPQASAAQPQFPVAAPMSAVQGDAGCGTPYAVEMGCGAPYMTEMGGGFDEDGMMMSMPSPEMYPSPAPE